MKKAQSISQTPQWTAWILFEASTARILPYTLTMCAEPSMQLRLCRARLSSLFVHVQSALGLRMEPKSPPFPQSQSELGETTLGGHGILPALLGNAVHSKPLQQRLRSNHAVTRPFSLHLDGHNPRSRPQSFGSYHQANKTSSPLGVHDPTLPRARNS